MKTYKELVEGINETLSFLEELEELDEANENFVVVWPKHLKGDLNIGLLY